VFFPEATAERCTAALLLEVDPVEMVRGKAGSRMGGPLDQYVNDRPYAASSLLSVAIAQVFGSAFRGQCQDRPALAETAIPLTASLPALPCRRGGEPFLRQLFEKSNLNTSSAWTSRSGRWRSPMNGCISSNCRCG